MPGSRVQLYCNHRHDRCRDPVDMVANEFYVMDKKKMQLDMPHGFKKNKQTNKLIGHGFA